MIRGCRGRLLRVIVSEKKKKQFNRFCRSKCEAFLSGWNQQMEVAEKKEKYRKHDQGFLVFFFMQRKKTRAVTLLIRSSDASSEKLQFNSHKNKEKTFSQRGVSASVALPPPPLG